MGDPQAWPDKYRMQHEPPARPGSNFAVFDFSAVKMVPAGLGCSAGGGSA